MTWTPYQLEILLHHYCGPEPFDRRDAPIYLPTAAELCEAGLMKPSEEAREYAVTAMGQALIKRMLRTPVPPSVDALYDKWIEEQ